MKLKCLFLSLLLLASSVFASDPDPVNPVPSSNATFLSDLQQFLKAEDADRYGEQFTSFVHTGGIIATGAGLTKTPTALTAYPGGYRITESGAIVFTDNTTCYVIASRTTTGNLTTFTRVSGTHYLIDCTSVSEPALPNSTTLRIATVVTKSGSVTTSTDRRVTSPIDGLTGASVGSGDVVIYETTITPALGDLSASITFPTTLSTSSYEITVTSSFHTGSWYVTSQTTSGFTLEWVNGAPGGASIFIGVLGQGAASFIGPAGPAGTSGIFGGDSQPYTYSTTITDADPGIGKIRFNSLTPASITKAYIDLLNSDSVDITTWLDALDDSTSTVKGTVRFFKKSDQSIFATYQIAANTSASGYRKLNLTYVIANGFFADGDAIIVSFSRAGDIGTPADSDITFTDITTNNVTSTKHGFAPKSPGDATKFLNGAVTPDYAQVKDSDLSTSNITTNDVTTAKHGFTPQAPNDTTKFLRGDATWAIPTGSYFPDTTRKGSIVAASGRSVIQSAANPTCWIIGSVASGNTLLSHPWSEPGFFRNLSVDVDAALSTGNVLLGMFATHNNGGAVGFTHALSGVSLSYDDASIHKRDPIGFVYAQKSQLICMEPNSFTGSGATVGTVHAMASEFLSDVTPSATVVSSWQAAALTASVSQDIGPWGQTISGSTPTDLNNAIAFPVAGTVSNLQIVNTLAPTNAVTWTFRVNNADTTLTLSRPNTGVNLILYDKTHTVSVNAGDYATVRSTTGATTQTEIQVLRYTFQPTTGNTSIVGGFIGATVSTTPTYNAPLSTNNSTTLANNQLGFPIACTASKLYVIQQTANGGGVTTTFTLNVNGVDTALTGTITSGTTITSPVLLDGTHTVSIAQDALVTLKYVTGSGTSGTIGSWSMACD